MPDSWTFARAYGSFAHELHNDASSQEGLQMDLSMQAVYHRKKTARRLPGECVKFFGIKSSISFLVIIKIQVYILSLFLPLFAAIRPFF
jgi:hypothetical protein